jgi:ABC-type multidrug transport system fused ATPase/permease subunit
MEADLRAEDESSAVPRSSPLAAQDEERGPSMRDLMRTIRLSLRYRAAIAGTLVCAAVFSACRYVKTWLAMPFLDDIVPAMSQGNFDYAVLEPRLWEVGTILAITLVITPPAMFFRLYLANWVVGRTRQDVDQKVAGKFLSAPLRLHRGEASGELLSRALTDAHLACRTLEVLYKDVLEDVMLLVGGVIAMFLLSWQLSLLSMATMPILLLVLAFFGNRIQKKTQRRQETQSDLSQHLIAILSGIKVIKAFQGRDVELAAFSQETQTYFRRHMKVILNRALAKTTSESVNQIVGAAIILVGTYFAWKQMFDVTFGTLGAFVLMLVQVYKPIKSLTISYTTIMESNAGAQRLFEVFDMEEEVPDRPNAKPMRGLTQGIRFRDVHFDYGQGTILAGIDLEVKPGEVIAFVGRTGTGKSTLMDLLLRFHDPTRGSIEIDGVDLRDLKRQSFLDHVAVVTQEPFLFDVSILENIRYGKPDASFEEVRAAAAAASADEFIDELPLGYETPVGEFGLRLSGGQRQRITIARAILADPTILVFDEATSALDAKTERAVQRAIEALRGQRTIFLVAHRLTTIRHADRIVVLDQGRIVEIGDHETLLSRPGIYRELVGADRQTDS